MTERDKMTELWDKIERDAAREQAKKFEQAYDEIAGNVRRMWREIRAGMLDEGVPEDLVDSVVADMVKMLANAGQK